MNRATSKQELVPVKSKITESMNKIDGSLRAIKMILALILVFQLLAGIDYATWIYSIMSFISYCAGIIWLGTYLIAAKMIGEKYEMEVFGCIFAFFGAPNPTFALPALRYIFIVCCFAFPIIEAIREYRYLKAARNESSAVCIHDWEKWSCFNFAASAAFLITAFMYFRSYSDCSNFDFSVQAAMLTIVLVLFGIATIFTECQISKYENVCSNESAAAGGSGTGSGSAT